MTDLRALALAATPGHVHRQYGSVQFASFGESAEFYAAWTPDRILALLDRLDALERVAEAARGAEEACWPMEGVDATYGIPRGLVAALRAALAALEDVP